MGNKTFSPRGVNRAKKATEHVIELTVATVRFTEAMRSAKAACRELARRLTRKTNHANSNSPTSRRPLHSSGGIASLFAASGRRCSRHDSARGRRVAVIPDENEEA